MGRFPDASSYVCKSLGLRGFEFQLDMMFILFPGSNKWSQPMHMNLGIPTARAAHGMCSVGRNLVIFGGRDTQKRTNDIHMYNIGKRSSSHVLDL